MEINTVIWYYIYKIICYDNYFANNIEITILEVKGDQVKIGINAPKEVPIYRKEVYLQIQEANKEAMAADGMEALKNLLG